MQNYEKVIEYGIELIKPIVAILSGIYVAKEIEEMVDPNKREKKEHRIY